MSNNHAATLLARFTFLRDHPDMQGCDYELGRVPWDYIDSREWTPSQLILIEVLRFIMTGNANVQLEDLNYLTEVERHAVVLALNEKYSMAKLEENLAR